MTDQSKTPGAMVRQYIHNLKIHAGPFADLVSGVKTNEVRKCHDRDFQVGDKVELFLVDESGGNATQSIVRRITHIQRGYGLPDNLCVLSYAPAEQSPAVCGEPEVLGWIVTDMNGDFYFAVDKQTPNDAALIDRAHLAPLQAEIQRSTARELLRLAEIEHLTKRVAELEAQQSEPAAYVLHKNGEVDWDQETVISNTGGDEQDERWKWEPVFRQARPATAKVVLPEPVDIEKPRTQPNSWDDHGMGWNACLDAIAELNP